MKEVADHFVTDVKDMTCISRSGFRYILTFVDRKSRFLKIYLLRRKSEVQEKTRDFISWVQTQKEKNPKKISSDYGGEYTCHDLQKFCEGLGVEWEYTEADTPQQNGIAERINRTVMEGSSAMRHTANLPEEFWEDAVMYFVHIKNRTPHKFLNKKAPIDVWNAEQQEEARGVWGFKTFGCEAYKAMVGDKKERGKKMVYLGVCDNRKTDKFYDMEEEKVVFGYCRYYDESCFPMREQVQSVHVPAVTRTVYVEVDDKDQRTEKQRGAEREMTEERRQWWRQLFEDDFREFEDEVKTHKGAGGGDMGCEARTQIPLRGGQREEKEEVEVQHAREQGWSGGKYEVEEVLGKRRSRFGKRRGFDYLVKWTGDWGADSQEWIPQAKLRGAKEVVQLYEQGVRQQIDTENESNVASTTAMGNPAGSNNISQNGINNDVGKIGVVGSTTTTGCTTEVLNTEEDINISQGKAAAFLAQLVPKKKQFTRKDASSRPDWDQFLKAEEEEVRSGFETGCFRAVRKEDVPSGATILSSMMVYKKKEATALEPERYRSRLCVLGNRQKPDSYSETFAAVAKVKTFRVLLAIAVHLGLKMSQLDISNAFMNSRLPEEIYMHPPKGWEHLGILKLDRSLYGLKQAPRLWYETLTGKLKGLGFIKVDSDVCCFKHPKEQCYILIYVDDVIILTKNELMRYNLVEELKKEFKLRNFEDARLYVGLELVWETDKVSVTQKTMTQEILQTYRHDEAEAVATPQEPKQRLENIEGVPTKAPYRELVGSLLFLLSTRPDIAGAVRELSQFMQNAAKEHWTAAKRVLSYLKGTAASGICYIKNPKFRVHAYCDSDFAEHRKDRKSVGAYVIYTQGGPVIWKSKKQPVVAQSSAEAEYIALAECVKDLIWLKMLLWELEVDVELPVVVYIDNAAAKALAENPIDHDRSKHIDIRYHLIRHHVELGWLKIRKVEGARNVADVLTKPVTETVFRRLGRSLLNWTSLGYYSVDDG